MKPLSIRSSLILSFVGLTSLLLVALSAIFYGSIHQVLHSGLETRLSTTATGIVAISDWDEHAKTVEFELTDEWKAQLKASHPNGSLGLWIWPSKQLVYYSGPELLNPLPDPIEFAGVDYFQAPAVSFETADLESGQQRICTMLAYSPDNPEEPEKVPFTILVRVSEDLAPTDARLAKVTNLVFILAFASLLVVLILAVLLSRRIIKPLHQLGVAASAVRAGRPTQIPNRGVGDEVDRLGDLLKEAFHRLEQALNRQTRFTSDAAHELRNPIAVIQNAAEIALRRERSVSEYQDFFQDVLTTSRRMGQVVEALLLLARLDAGKAEDSFNEVDLVQVARDCLSSFPKAKNRLQIHSDGATYIRGDDGLLRVLINNLLSNALRYSDAESKVTIEIQNKEGVSLSVVDEGPGIPAHAVDRVFDRFYRVENANPDVHGAGLGLALVAEVASVHSVESVIDTSSRGTRITVRFPADQ